MLFNDEVISRAELVQLGSNFLGSVAFNIFYLFDFTVQPFSKTFSRRKDMKSTTYESGLSQ